jgi:acetylornithine/N-succinyldiaminopimelate aminotransferase
MKIQEYINTKRSNQSLHEIDEQHFLPCIKRFPITLAKGRGSHVWDIEGNEYIDALAGIAVNNAGHCHPRIVKTIQEQAARLIHISNYYLSEPQAMLEKKLTDLSGLNRVFFTNSGAESVEGAIKIARKYAHKMGRGGTIISFDNCFHGRTLGTIATGKKSMQSGFEPIPDGFKHVAFNDLEAVKAAADQDTAAILIEPVQGEGGINVADKQFMQELRRFCDDQNIVLIFDEIQCGLGRTGKFLAKEHFGVQPDIIALAKALGGGFPIGAILSNEIISSAIAYGDHGTTFGGNPLACASALTVLEIIQDENLVHQSEEKGNWLMEKLKKLNDPSIKEIRGMGLMIGVEFDFETKPLVEEMMKNGVLANATAGNVLRLVPPLNIGYNDLEIILHVMKKSIKAITENV